MTSESQAFGLTFRLSVERQAETSHQATLFPLTKHGFLIFSPNFLSYNSSVRFMAPSSTNHLRETLKWWRTILNINFSSYLLLQFTTTCDVVLHSTPIFSFQRLPVQSKPPCLSCNHVITSFLLFLSHFRMSPVHARQWSKQWSASSS